jgi:hypothetical protein
MKRAIILIAGMVVLVSAQSPTTQLATYSLVDGKLTIDKLGADALYEQEMRARVAAQITEALGLMPVPVSQATLDAAITTARTQILQQVFQQMSAADTATARNLEVQMLTRLAAELQARLAELNQQQ